MPCRYEGSKRERSDFFQKCTARGKSSTKCLAELNKKYRTCKTKSTKKRTPRKRASSTSRRRR